MRLVASVFALLIFALLLFQVAVTAVYYLTPRPVRAEQRTLRGF